MAESESITKALEQTRSNFEKLDKFIENTDQRFNNVSTSIDNIEQRIEDLVKLLKPNPDTSNQEGEKESRNRNEEEAEGGDEFFEASDVGQQEEVETNSKVLESRNKTNASFSPLIAAHKYYKLVVPPLPAEGGHAIEGWLKDALASLSEAVPQLSEIQLINVIASNLPDKLNAIVRGCKMDNRDQFVEHVTAIFSNSELGSEAAKRKFYAYSGAGKEILEIIADLISLSKNIEKEPYNQRKAVNELFVSLIPQYQHRITLKTILRDQEDMDILDLSKIIHTNVAMKTEIEKAFKRQLHPNDAQPKKTVNQVMKSSGSDSAKMDNTKGKIYKPKVKKERCARCGNLRHLTDDCPLYKKTANAPCSECKSLVGYSHYHESDDCIIRPRLAKN